MTLISGPWDNCGKMWASEDLSIPALQYCWRQPTWPLRLAPLNASRFPHGTVHFVVSPSFWGLYYTFGFNLKASCICFSRAHFFGLSSFFQNLGSSFPIPQFFYCTCVRNQNHLVDTKVCRYCAPWTITIALEQCVDVECEEKLWNLEWRGWDPGSLLTAVLQGIYLLYP